MLHNLPGRPLRNSHAESRTCWCQPTAYALCEACGGLDARCTACDGDGLVSAAPGTELHSYVWVDHSDPYAPRRRLTIPSLGCFVDENGEPCVADRAEVVGMLKGMIEG